VLAACAAWVAGVASIVHAASPTSLPSLRPVAPERLQALKSAAERRYQRNPGSSRLSPGESDQSANTFPGLNWRGLTAADNSDANQGSPSDSTGAIGPTRYVEFVNSKIAVFDRANGSRLSTADAEIFAGRPGDSVFDVQIQYDPVSDHWFYSAADIDGSGNAGLVYGWSKSPDPTDLSNSNWCQRFISSDTPTGDPPGSFIDDYPHLGHSDSTVVIGDNVFDNTSATGPFITARIWSYPKPTNFGNCASVPAIAPVAGNPHTGNPPLKTADGDDLSTPIPVNLADSSSSAFVLAADDPTVVANAHQIDVLALPNSATINNLGNVDVGSSYDVPANAPQPGTAFTLDTLEGQLSQAVGHADPGANGSEALWTQHTVAGPGGRAAVRWYEILPGSLSVRQQGTISDSSNFDFNGAISPAMIGDEAAIHYNVSSGSQIPQVRAQSRQPSSALGQMSGEVTLATSDASFQEFTCVPFPIGDGPPCRWGDYAGASPDPAQANQVWGTTQLAGQPSSTLDPAWITQNFALVAGPPPDTTGPNVTLFFKRQKSRRALRRGVKGKASCDEPCTITLQGAGKTTRKKTLDVKQAGSRVQVRLKLTRKAKRKLRRNGRLRVKIKATATDAAGNVGQATKRVKIR
jgi:hypothetical protein